MLEMKNRDELRKFIAAAIEAIEAKGLVDVEVSNGRIAIAKERWHVLVNTVAEVWNNGLVPGDDKECVKWARRQILNHADAPAVRSDELMALAKANTEQGKLQDKNARLEAQIAELKGALEKITDGTIASSGQIYKYREVAR